MSNHQLFLLQGTYYINIRKGCASNYSYPTRTYSLHRFTNIFGSTQEPHQVILLHFITIFMHCGHKSKERIRNIALMDFPIFIMYVFINNINCTYIIWPHFPGAAVPILLFSWFNVHYSAPISSLDNIITTPQQKKDN